MDWLEELNGELKGELEIAKMDCWGKNKISFFKIKKATFRKTTSRFNKSPFQWTGSKL